MSYRCLLFDEQMQESENAYIQALNVSSKENKDKYLLFNYLLIYCALKSTLIVRLIVKQQQVIDSYDIIAHVTERSFQALAGKLNNTILTSCVD